jgi:hypothetical protein
MAVTAKKLCQSALSNSTTTMYTAPALTTTQVTEIWLANTNTTTTRKVTLYAHGTGTANVLLPAVAIPANGFISVSDAKIVLAAAQTISAKQDTGTDVTLTAYGVEEA